MTRNVAIAVCAILAVEAAVIVRFGEALGMFIPATGVLLNLAFVVHKVARTGAFTTWGLAKYPSTPLETRLQVSGLSLAAGSILLLWALPHFL